MSVTGIWSIVGYFVLHHSGQLLASCFILRNVLTYSVKIPPFLVTGSYWEISSKCHTSYNSTTLYPCYIAFFTSSVTHVPTIALSPVSCRHLSLELFSMHVRHKPNNSFPLHFVGRTLSVGQQGIILWVE